MPGNAHQTVGVEVFHQYNVELFFAFDDSLQAFGTVGISASFGAPFVAELHFVVVSELATVYEPVVL